MKSLCLLILTCLSFALFAQDTTKPKKPYNVQLRTRTMTDQQSRDSARREAQRQTDSLFTVVNRMLNNRVTIGEYNRYKDTIEAALATTTQGNSNGVKSSIDSIKNALLLKQNTADAISLSQLDARYPTLTAYLQAIAGTFKNADSLRFKNGILEKIPSVAFRDSIPKFYGPAGIINRPMRIWSDTGIVVTANPLTVNISSAGFSVITSVQITPRNAGGTLLANLPIAFQIPPNSPTVIKIGLGIYNTLGILSLLANFNGTTVSLRVEGY